MVTDARDPVEDAPQGSRTLCRRELLHVSPQTFNSLIMHTNNNNNTQIAAIAPGPETTHPEHWAEPTLHGYIHEMVVST